MLLDAIGLPEEPAFSKPGDYQPTYRGDLYDMLYPTLHRLDLEYSFAQPLEFSYAPPIQDVDDLRIETSSESSNAPPADVPELLRQRSAQPDGRKLFLCGLLQDHAIQHGADMAERGKICDN